MNTCRAGWKAFSAVIVITLAGCSWEAPEEVRFRGSPGLSVPAGSVTLQIDDFLDDVLDEIGDEFSVTVGDADSRFTGGEVSVPEGDPFTLFAELEIPTPDFKGDLDDLGLPQEVIDELAAGFTESFVEEFDLDLSDVFGPLPEQLDLVGASGRMEVDLEEGASLDEPIRVRMSSKSGAEPRRYIIGSAGSTDDNFGEFTDEDHSIEFDSDSFTKMFNDRQNTTIRYEFYANGSDAGKVDSITLRFEIPFQFVATADMLLDLSDDDDDDNPFVLDEDVFGRDPDDPDEDLNDQIRALRGSSASMSMGFENELFPFVMGLIDSRFTGDKLNENNWIFDLNLGTTPEGELETVEISADNFERLINADGDELFYPEFLIKLAEGDELTLLRGATFSIFNAQLRVDVAFDHIYTLE